MNNAYWCLEYKNDQNELVTSYLTESGEFIETNIPIKTLYEETEDSLNRVQLNFCRVEYSSEKVMAVTFLGRITLQEGLDEFIADLLIDKQFFNKIINRMDLS